MMIQYFKISNYSIFIILLSLRFIYKLFNKTILDKSNFEILSILFRCKSNYKCFNKTILDKFNYSIL